MRTWRTSFSLVVPFNSESGTLEMTISASAMPACASESELAMSP